MAVWGTPMATEDDAERAVRAALDLVAAVSALGDEVGAPGCARARACSPARRRSRSAPRARAWSPATSSTPPRASSRPRSRAPSSSVRRRAGRPSGRSPTRTRASIELKGKAGPVAALAGAARRLGRARRAQVGGARGAVRRPRPRAAPDQGALPRLAPRSARRSSSRSPASPGSASRGWRGSSTSTSTASRETVYWHRGRCLSYGEGVTYWALADMVRMRCRIAEDERAGRGAGEAAGGARGAHRSTRRSGASSSRGSRTCSGSGSRRAARPAGPVRRVAAVLRAAGRRATRRCSCSRTCSGRTIACSTSSSTCSSGRATTDLRRHARAAGAARAAADLGRRASATSPRSTSSRSRAQAMEELLDGLVPGLPDDAARADPRAGRGRPALRGRDRADAARPRPARRRRARSTGSSGEIEELEVPETLHALIAARLDGLAAEERRLLQDAAVLGKTFTRQALAALSRARRGRARAAARRRSSARRCSASRPTRARPSTASTAFLQDLVAPRRLRDALEAGAAGAATSPRPSISRASARRGRGRRGGRVRTSSTRTALDPDADDARDQAPARATLCAGGRACGVARRRRRGAALLRAGGRARRDEPLERAALLGRAGEMAAAAGRPRRGARALREAIALYERRGHARRRAVAGAGSATRAFGGRRDEAMARMERAFEVIAGDEPDEDSASARRASPRYWFGGDLERAAELTELALDIAEALRPPVTSRPRAGTRKANIVAATPAPAEARALLRHALDPLENDSPAATVSYIILSDAASSGTATPSRSTHLEQALALSRRLGNRRTEWSVLTEMTYPLSCSAAGTGARPDGGNPGRAPRHQRLTISSILTGVLELRLHRGELDQARVAARTATTSSHERQRFRCKCGYAAAEAAVRLAESRPADALVRRGARLRRAGDALGAIGAKDVKQGFLHALEAALALGRPRQGRRAPGRSSMSSTPVGLRPPFLAALTHRFRARLAGDKCQCRPRLRGGE